MSPDSVSKSLPMRSLEGRLQQGGVLRGGAHLQEGDFGVGEVGGRLLVAPVVAEDVPDAAEAAAVVRKNCEGIIRVVFAAVCVVFVLVMEAVFAAPTMGVRTLCLQVSGCYQRKQSLTSTAFLLREIRPLEELASGEMFCEVFGDFWRTNVAIEHFRVFFGTLLVL